MPINIAQQTQTSRFQYVLITLLLMLLLMYPSFTWAENSLRADNKHTMSATDIIPNYPGNLVLVGTAELSFLWFDIYKAALFNNKGYFITNNDLSDQIKLNTPLLLELKYERNIAADELIQETLKQWTKRNISADKQQIWSNQLTQIWPPIKEDDRLAFYIDEKQRGHFYFNKHYLGSITDSEFSHAFINIWLDKYSDYPKVSAALKGILEQYPNE